MITLGINDGHDAGVAILKDGEILYAANEERFSRTKLHHGFPHLALANACAEMGLSPNQIDQVAFGGYGPVYVPTDKNFAELEEISLLRRFYGIAARSGLIKMDGWLFCGFHRNLSKLQRWMPTRQASLSECRRVGLTGPYLHLDHHACHAACAYYTASFESATVFTLDGGGDGLSGSIWVGKQGELEKLVEIPKIHSAGNFWDYITYLCGFSPTRHGGKITGLAAYEPCPDAYDILKKYFSYTPEIPRWDNKKYLFWGEAIRVLQQELSPFTRQQIAWGAQKVLEENILGIVRESIRRTSIPYVTLAGGVFANVRLNQMILNLEEVEDVFIHPHMGDGGLAVGAAYLAQAPSKPRAMVHALLGINISDELVKNAAERMNVVAIPLEQPEQFIAESLAQHKVVGLVRGRAEYGPRALCHRSILAEPTDITMMDWLNDRLERTEFMPFAPVIMAEYASEYFKEYPAGAHTARFMTICYDATDLCRQKAPGIVHVDGTARPQVIHADQDRFMHNVLDCYRKLTCLPLCVNTSFNKHEEPIVNIAEDAIKELLAKRVDVLVINRFQIRY
jgi:carbamoyltransferase